MSSAAPVVPAVNNNHCVFVYGEINADADFDAFHKLWSSTVAQEALKHKDILAIKMFRNVADPFKWMVINRIATENALNDLTQSAAHAEYAAKIKENKFLKGPPRFFKCKDIGGYLLKNGANYTPAGFIHVINVPTNDSSKKQVFIETWNK